MLFKEVIKKNLSRIPMIFSENAIMLNAISQTQKKQVADQSEFFDNLYNWQDATNSIFNEEKEVKKEKKKMLSV